MATPQISACAAQTARTSVGCVVDGVTGRLVMNVRVAIRGTSQLAVTDSLGFFVLHGISPRESIVLTFTRSGYATNCRRAEGRSWTMSLRDHRLA